MPSLSDIISRHNRFQDSLLYSFENHLREIVMRAQGKTIALLHARLSMTGDVIDRTPANMAVLRRANQVFLDELRAAGYDRLVESFVGEFNGTLPFLRETIATLGEQAGQDWALKLTGKDTNLLASAQVNTVWALEEAMSGTAGIAITRGLFGAAGLRFGSLVELLTEKLGTSIAKARTIADTGMSVFYRTATDRAFQIIQADVPAQQLTYRYFGPVDKLERPFCRHLTDVDNSYTRAEIDRMDNGQFPVGSVFVTAGGFNCRHGFVLATDQWESDVKAPAVVAQPAAA